MILILKSGRSPDIPQCMCYDYIMVAYKISTFLGTQVAVQYADSPLHSIPAKKEPFPKMCTWKVEQLIHAHSSNLLPYTPLFPEQSLIPGVAYSIVTIFHGPMSSSFPF